MRRAVTSLVVALGMTWAGEALSAAAPTATPLRGGTLRATPVITRTVPKAARTPTPSFSGTRRARKTATPVVKPHGRKPTPTVRLRPPAPTPTVQAVRKAPGSRKRSRTRPVRFLFDAGGGLSFPDSDRFDGRGGPMLRGGVEVHVGRYWTLGLRGRASDMEWKVPDAADPGAPYAYRHARIYAGAAVSRILLKSRGTRPYLLGGVGVFKTDARPEDPASVYPHKGPFYPAGFGLDFELNPKWTLGVEACLLFLEDRASRRVTQVTDLGLHMGFGLD